MAPEEKIYCTFETLSPDGLTRPCRLKRKARLIASSFSAVKDERRNSKWGIGEFSNCGRWEGCRKNLHRGRDLCSRNFVDTPLNEAPSRFSSARLQARLHGTQSLG
jgi:hypothetical protein